MTTDPQVASTPQIEFEDRPEGPVSAAIMATGIGVFALGVFTVFSESVESIHDFFDWSSRVGPLSGKTICAVIVWLVAWAVLHAVLRATEYESRRALTIALLLIALGLIGTFPEFFQAF